jgi:hypothetical protein
MCHPAPTKQNVNCNCSHCDTQSIAASVFPSDGSLLHICVNLYVCDHVLGSQRLTRLLYTFIGFIVKAVINFKNWLSFRILYEFPAFLGTNVSIPRGGYSVCSGR